MKGFTLSERAVRRVSRSVKWTESQATDVSRPPRIERKVPPRWPGVYEVTSVDTGAGTCDVQRHVDDTTTGDTTWTCDYDSEPTTGDLGAILRKGDGSLFFHRPGATAADVPIIFEAGDGSAVIETGAEAWVRIGQAGTLTEWTLLADQSGSITIDVWKDTYANYPPTDADSITNGNEPTLTTATKAEDTDLTDWSDTSISDGDVLYFHVDSATTVTKIFLELMLS